MTAMSALLIELPDELADTSRAVAQRLGLTPSELVRRALANEIEKIQSYWERDAMAASFAAMKLDPVYLAEAAELDTGLDTLLAQERDEWWKS